MDRSISEIQERIKYLNRLANTCDHTGYRVVSKDLLSQLAGDLHRLLGQQAIPAEAEGPQPPVVRDVQSTTQVVAELKAKANAKICELTTNAKLELQSEGVSNRFVLGMGETDAFLQMIRWLNEFSECDAS